MRFLNWHSDSDVVGAGLGLEALLRDLKWIEKLKYLLYLIGKIFKKPESGIGFVGHAKGWNEKQRVSRSNLIRSKEISEFHKRCKRVGLSLNSGFISALYEVLAKDYIADNNSKKLETAVTLDARTRFTGKFKVPENTIGNYAGIRPIHLIARPGLWDHRALAIHQNVRSGERESFTKGSFMVSLLGKHAQALERVEKDLRTQERVGMFFVKNLGRMQKIDRAKEEVLDSDQENPIKIERMALGSNHK